MEDAGILIFEMILHSWEAWLFFVLLVGTACTLVDRSTRLYTNWFLKVGGVIMLALFLMREAIDGNLELSNQISEFGSHDPNYEIWMESVRDLIIRIFEKVVLVLFAVIWGASYLGRPTHRFVSEK